MPHNFVKINVTSPNPGRRTRANVDPICRKHHATLEYLWFDDDEDPTFAYVLVKDGDIDGIMQDLHAHQVVRLFEVTD